MLFYTNKWVTKFQKKLNDRREMNTDTNTNIHENDKILSIIALIVIIVINLW